MGTDMEGDIEMVTEVEMVAEVEMDMEMNKLEYKDNNV